MYDAYGNLLVREGDTENDFLYCGEQYNALTGLYYLRARYMNPATGTFISEDAYAGRMNESVTLHKYLYAHANPVKYTDPSGYMADTMAAVAIQGELSAGTVEVSILMSIWMLLKLNDIIKSSEAVRFSDFYQSDAQINPEGAAEDARDGLEQEKVNEESGIENSDIPAEVRDILNGAKPGRKTRGKSQQWEKPGNYDTAKGDYNKLNPENSKEIPTQYGPGQAGTLSDGSKVNVRPGSSGGPPTLEVDLLSGKKVKIRYGE